MKKTLFTLMVIVLMALTATAQNNKPKPITQEDFEALCPTPPMGWNSWNKFGCNVSEQLLMEAADALVASGMKDAGYEYIVSILLSGSGLPSCVFRSPSSSGGV